MKKMGLIGVLFLLFSQKNAAQIITKQEAEKILKEMYNAKIISERVENALLKKAEEQPQNDTLTKSKLFYSCYIWQTYPYYTQRNKDVLKEMRESIEIEELKEYDIMIDSLGKVLRAKGKQAKDYWIDNEEIEESFYLSDLFFKADDIAIREFPTISVPYSRFSVKRANESERKSILQIAENQLNYLKKKNIITNRVRKNLLNGAKQGQYADSLTYRLYSIFEWLENYEKYKSKQIEKIDTLKSRGWLSDENYRKILNSYKPYKLKSDEELIRKFSNVTLVEYDNYPKNEMVFYKGILKTIRKILPAFNFTDLVIETDSLPDDSQYMIKGGDTIHYIKHNVHISLKVNNITYKSDFEYSSYAIYSSQSIIGHNTLVRNIYSAIQVVDKFLADNNSDKRVFFFPVSTRKTNTQTFAVTVTKFIEGWDTFLSGSLP